MHCACHACRLPWRLLRPYSAEGYVREQSLAYYVTTNAQADGKEPDVEVCDADAIGKGKQQQQQQQRHHLTLPLLTWFA